MGHPKPSNINITITSPSTRPSTMDTSSIVNPSTPHRRSIQQSLEHSPTTSSSASTSSASSSLVDAQELNQSRHVQGLPASALATIDAVLDRDAHGPFLKNRQAEDSDDEGSVEMVRGSRRMSGPVTQDHPLGYGPAVAATRQPVIKHAPAPLSSAKNQQSRQAFRNRVGEPAHPTRAYSPGRRTRVEEANKDDSGSGGSRGEDGGHFYSSYGHPPQQQQPSADTKKALSQPQHLEPRQQQRLQQQYEEFQQAQLDLYRTSSFLSELSLERPNNGDEKGRGGDGGGGYLHYDIYNRPLFKPDPLIEKMIVRKLDRNLLPLLGILYLFSYLDRVNIGNARLFGLEDAVHLTSDQYNIALASFFLAYCIFEMPSNWILLRLGPRVWIPTLMFVWGGISLAMAWVKDFNGLVIARFALGAAEAGFVPGVLYYLTLFYKRSEHSLRMAIFLCFNIMAGAFGGLLAAGISRLSGKLNLQGWQWIFILEAIPTTLLAFLTYCILTPTPSQAKFLTPDERIYAANRILMDCDVLPTANASWRQTRAALGDFKIYMICLMGMFLHVPSAGLVMFMPTLVADMGFTATTAQLLTVPPYMIAACFALALPWWSDRIQARGVFVIFVPFVSVCGFMILALAPWTWVRYGALVLALVGIMPTSAILTSWLTNNIVGHSKRATALAMMVSLTSLASLAGTQVYRVDDAPRYQRGHWIMLGCISLEIITAAIFRAILSRENKNRDKNLSKGLTLVQFMSEGHLNDLGDMHPNFRYTL